MRRAAAGAELVGVLEAPAVSVPTTAVTQLLVYQGSEPRIFRVHIWLAVKAALGETDERAPVDSEPGFRTY